jgi:hypothetical protein
LKKLTSLDHDNLEKYCINLEGFFKHDNLILMVFIFRIRSLTRDFTKMKKDSD